MAGGALHTNLSQVTRRVRLFGNIVGWVLGDVYRNAKGQFVLIFALSVLGVIARLGVIAVLMTFVHAQTSGRPVVVGGFELPSDTGFWTLTLWGGSVLLLSVATGLANYLAEVRNFRLAREAMDRAVGRTLAVVAAGQSRPLTVWANDGMKGMARKVVMGDAMMLARSVLLIGGLSVSMTTFLIAVVALFIFNAQLTTILAPVFLIYAVPFYMLNRAVVNASREYEDRRTERAGVLGGLLAFASQTQYPGVTRPAWTELYQADPSVSGAMDAFRGIIMPRRRVAFLQDVFLGVILLVLLVVFGSFLVSDELAWVPFISYFVALRFAITGMGGTAAIVTAMNRFVPQLLRLKEFTSYDLERSGDERREPEDRPITLQPHEPLIDGTLEQLTTAPGDVLFCFQPVLADAYSLEEFADQLIGEPAASKAFLSDLFLRGDLCAFPSLTVAQIVTGSQAPSREDIQSCEQVLKSCGVLDELTGLEQGMQTIMTPQVQQTLSQQCQFAMCLVPGLRTNKKYFLLSWRAMLTMHEESRAKVLSLLSDRVVLLLSNSATKWLPPEASHALLMDATGLRGIGDAAWFKGAVEQRLTAASVDAGAMIESSDLSDDDELMATL